MTGLVLELHPWKKNNSLIELAAFSNITWESDGKGFFEKRLQRSMFQAYQGFVFKVIWEISLFKNQILV